MLTVPVFSRLQAAIDEGRTDELVFFAFDLLFLNGESAAQLPPIQRGVGCNAASSNGEDPLRTVSMDAIFCKREISFLLMPNSADLAQILQEVLGEADALIRCLLEERAVEVPHAARGGRTITLAHLQFVRGLVTRTSSQR